MIDMRMIFLIPTVVICFSTACLKKEKIKDALAKESIEEQVQQVSSFNCSELKGSLSPNILINQREDFDDIKIEGLKRVDKNFYESTGIEKVFNTPYSDIEAYFYSYTSLTDCSILLLGVNQGDDVMYQLHMINLDSAGKLKSHFLLSQYIPYPDGEEFTRSIYGKNLNDVLRITMKSSIGDYNKDTGKYSMVVDSISSKYVLNKSGALTLIQRDSVRMIKH